MSKPVIAYIARAGKRAEVGIGEIQQYEFMALDPGMYTVLNLALYRAAGG